MKAWQAVIIAIGLLAVAVAIVYQKPHNTTPEEIEIHRYYNEDSQVECFYHQNAISCLWVMDGGK